jgi:alginate O-acetyltransferase complex protein AlgI
MLFNSPEFILLFLPAAFALHFALARSSISAAAIGTTASSLLFYTWWNPPFVVLPVASIAVNFWLARRIVAADKARARFWLAAGICANLLVLCWFKYADFLISIIDGHRAAPPNVPLALSFTTFVQIAFLVHVDRTRAVPPLSRYSLFVSFFPHLIAGPIVRWESLGRQLDDKSRYRPNWDNIALGLTIFVLGLVKKLLLADPLARFVAIVFDAAAHGEPLTVAAAWGGCVLFAAQLYFDFSGYSDMAIGLGLLFNYRLPINFAAPLRSVSIVELWRRWHISLLSWFRDYLYVPLGGSRVGVGRWLVNVLAVFVLSGLWHGAAWGFVAWGAFNGVLLVINRVWRWLLGRSGPGTPIGRFFGWTLTFASFAVGMAFFRAPDIATSWHLLQAMAGFGHPVAAVSPFDAWAIRNDYLSPEFAAMWFGKFWSLGATVAAVVAVAIIALVPDTLELTGYREGEEPTGWRRNVGVLAWHPSPVTLALTGAAFVVVFFRIAHVQDFLYYQF